MRLPAGATSVSDAFYALDPDAIAARYATLARAALRRWGIEAADLTLLKMRENAVFRVARAGADPVVLRIHRHGYHTDAELRSELQWMQALATAGVDVPEVLPTLDGQLLAVVDDPAVPEPRQIDLFSWVGGRQLGSVETGADMDRDRLVASFRTLGDLAARLHLQSSDWTLPAGFTRHAWDVEGLVGEAPFWGPFWALAALTPEQRELIARARLAVHDGLSALPRTPDVYSLIHADLTPENVLCEGDRVRLLDFDDAGHGWHLFEIATALYFHTDADYFPAARDALLEGYLARRPLPPAMLAQLPLFLLARGLTYLGWVHTRAETETARELTPMLVDMACARAREIPE